MNTTIPVDSLTPVLDTVTPAVDLVRSLDVPDIDLADIAATVVPVAAVVADTAGDFAGTASGSIGRLGSKIRRHPVLAAVLAVGAVGAIAVVVAKRRSDSETPDAATTHLTAAA